MTVEQLSQLDKAGPSESGGPSPRRANRLGHQRVAGPLACSWSVWGARATLGVTTVDQLHPARLIVAGVIADMDSACNRFVPESDIGRCNAASGRWVPVSPAFLDALQVALDAAADTHGIVDPTVGGALIALGYDRDFDELRAAAPAPLPARACVVPGWVQVDVDRKRRRVRVPAGTSLDLGATAKALCVDRAADLVARRLNIGVMVGIGGDIAVGGRPPVGGWNIAVQESSREPDVRPDCVVAVSEGGLASSGTTVRCWTVADTTVHHIIDPTTGRPAAPVWRMVTAAASTCVAANVAATASIVWGEHAIRELESRAVPARLVDADARVAVICGWPEDPV